MFATENWGTVEEADSSRTTHGNLVVCYPTQEGCILFLFFICCCCYVWRDLEYVFVWNFIWFSPCQLPWSGLHGNFSPSI